MDNIDYNKRYELWFYMSALMATFGFFIKLFNLIAIEIDQLAIFALTQLCKLLTAIFAIVWFFVGAYWRYSAWGQLCAVQNLYGISKVLSVLYYGAVIGSLCLCSCYSCGSMLYVLKD